MSTVAVADDILTQFDTLPAQAQAEVLTKLVGRQSGGRFGITHTPNIMGGAACVAGTRIPVWVLERMRQLGDTLSGLLDGYPTLTAADILDAWAYADAHREEIEKDIAISERD